MTDFKGKNYYYVYLSFIDKSILSCIYDRTKLLSIIREKSVKHKANILAYKINRTAVAMVVEITNNVLPIYLGEVNGSYSQVYSVRMGYRKSVFEKKYDYFKISNDTQLKDAINHIHTNQAYVEDHYAMLTNPNSYHEYLANVKPILIKEIVKNSILSIYGGLENFKYIAYDMISINDVSSIHRVKSTTLSKIVIKEQSEYEVDMLVDSNTTYGK